jgi:hypothetical protein
VVVKPLGGRGLRRVDDDEVLADPNTQITDSPELP